MSDPAVLKKPPIITYVVIGLCVLVYLWELANFPAVEATLVDPIRTQGVSALWTLFTMTLVHSRTQITHIVFNLMAFSVLGRLLETLYGSLRYAVLLVVLAWVASAAQIVVEHNVGIGLSGVIYGIFGFMIGASPNNPFLWWFVKKNAPMLIGWAILCVVLTQMHVLAIGNGAHFGGLIYGIIYGLIYGLPRYRYAFIGLAIVIPIILGGVLVFLLTSPG
ncbi:MAG: rhomboid family intramembrane serine protease [Verrucomicrobia bacterium]|nr:rhomboid family intramembrane serine protease [Verrucomicrobiota bacterium]MBV8485447.1 rhomboid family intramembrane serine protease [Verrucomicrobiota bacterium]